MRRATGLAALLAGGVLFQGCAARGHVATPAELSELRATDGLSSAGKITLEGPRGRFSTRIVFGVTRNGALRLEIPSGTGLRFLLICREGRLRASLPQERAYYEGPASSAVMERLFGIDLAPSELAGAILGAPPDSIASRVRYDGGRPAQLSLERAATRLTLTFDDPETRAPGEAAFAFPPPSGDALDLDAMAARLGLTR